MSVCVIVILFAEFPSVSDIGWTHIFSLAFNLPHFFPMSKFHVSIFQSFSHFFFKQKIILFYCWQILWVVLFLLYSRVCRLSWSILSASRFTLWNWKRINSNLDSACNLTSLCHRSISKTTRAALKSLPCVLLGMSALNIWHV